MVKIHFWQEKETGKICMEAQGHANAAPYGEDLICASATMLVYTVTQAMTFYYKQGFLQEKPKIKIREGEAFIHVIPKEEYRAETLHSFWVAQCGAQVLAKNYPEHVSMTI